MTLFGIFKSSPKLNDMKASIVFFPNESKKNQKTGKIPLYMRIGFKNAKAESRLNAEISQTELSKWDPMTMRMAERNSAVNHQLNRLDQKFSEFLILNTNSLSAFTASCMKDYVLGTRKSQVVTLVKFVDDYFENAVANNVSRTPGTIKNYRRAINHFNAFLEFRNQKTLLVEQLNYEIASDFKNYLVNSNPQLKRVGMTEVSAAGVIKKFRTIFTQAVDQDLLKRNPFKMVKIKAKSPRRERLTIEQVTKIYQLDLKLFPYQELYRDIFLFSVFTGLAYHDAMSLTWASLEIRKDDTYKLTINRQKTDVITECFLPEQAVQIGKKYKTSMEGNISNSVLPHRSNKEMNLQLKLIAQMAGITIRLSTHIARHTFRQLLAEAGITDYGVIKRMMGQSRNGDVDEVYYSVTEKGLMHAKNKFDNFLKIYLYEKQ